MLDTALTGLSFVSASLVALIALGLGLTFLLFSASAVVLAGQFLAFAAPARVALPASGAGALVAWAAAGALGLGPRAAAGQLLASLAVWGLSRAPRPQRGLRRAAGAGLLLGGGLFALSVFMPEWEPLGASAVGALTLLLGGAALGAAPLLLAGVLRHAAVQRVEWFVSVRFLLARRRQTFVSAISVICAGGIAIGVALITVVLSVMNGFSQVMEEKLVNARGHVVVLSRFGASGEDWPALRLRALELPAVRGVTPFFTAGAIARSGEGKLESLQLKGVDLATIDEATGLRADVTAGALDALRERDPPRLVLGVVLAQNIGVKPGDELTLISTRETAPRATAGAPRTQRFRVVGLWRSGMYELDRSLAYTDLGSARAFARELGSEGLEIRTDDPYRSGETALALGDAFGRDFIVYDWKHFFPGLFESLENQRVMMFIILSFVMVVASFITVATLMMMIMERGREIAILKVMGCADEGILRIFGIQGFLIGALGVAAGLGVGLMLAANLDEIQGAVESLSGIDVLPEDVYQLPGLVYAVEPLQLAGVAAIALGLSIGAGLAPSRHAARLQVVEALRDE